MKDYKLKMRNLHTSETLGWSCPSFLFIFYFILCPSCLLWINKAKPKDKMYMSVGVMKDYKLKLRKFTPRMHWKGVPLQVRHLHSENTMVHTSTFRKYKVSSEKKKLFVPPSEITCTTFRIFKKECCFSLNVVFRTPFYHYLFKKKPSHCFWTSTRQCGMLSARRSTTRTWGCTKHDCLCSRVGLHNVPTHTYVNSWPSCLLQCRTYPGSHESTVHVVMGRDRQNAFVGTFAFLCAHASSYFFMPFCSHMFGCDMLHQDHGYRGHCEMTCAHWFSFTRSTPLQSWRWSIEAALINCIVPDPFQPTMHPHDSAFSGVVWMHGWLQWKKKRCSSFFIYLWMIFVCTVDTKTIEKIII